MDQFSSFELPPLTIYPLAIKSIKNESLKSFFYRRRPHVNKQDWLNSCHVSF